jgi:hypothetical protein
MYKYIVLSLVIFLVGCGKETYICVDAIHSYSLVLKNDNATLDEQKLDLCFKKGNLNYYAVICSDGNDKEETWSFRFDPITEKLMFKSMRLSDVSGMSCSKK